MNLYQKLQWLIRMGVDEIIAETPLNRLKTAPVTGESTRIITPPSVNVVPQTVPAANDTALQTAVTLATGAQTIAALKQALDQFDACSLKKTAAHTVFAKGNPSAKLMIIGDVPEAQEDKTGEPFAGESGALLEKMMAAIGLNMMTDCYMSVLIPWRAPGSRKPTPAEIAVCLPFLKRHIELVHPDMLLLFGGLTSGALLGIDSLSKARGTWHNYVPEQVQAPIPCLVTFSPTYLLKNTAQKKHAWEDLKRLKTKLETL